MNFEKPEISEFWKTEKKLHEISSFYTCVPKTAIIWGTVPGLTQKTEILKNWKKTFGDAIILQHLVQQKSQSNDVCICLLRYGLRQTTFCHFRPFFALLPHYWHWKLKFGKNVKKTHGDIILLLMCTINEDHMMYGSWDIKCKGQHCLSF